ncbi:DUF4136 domain-containing protein [Flavobacterium orientale]|uniref:DUF4136 domain-containing protein n=1 Tax=Flavobacterium orientale TaxID=1756020 RepID=A0A916XW08_9FLAO|nr:DUF4136 domain-containing protein [Flavobacterium orientale]GGD14415.1 hypothetical protein GCM10011343_01860 [Flavobacterium orientale]
MKTMKLIPFLLLFALASCSSVRVASDFDKTAPFEQYKTFAYHKPSIDKVEISDLDKKRILKAIDEELLAKGFAKSENPDVLISIFTKDNKRVDVWNNNFGWGWGWGWGFDPWMWGGRTSVSTVNEGTLYIDIIDTKKNELVWQGEGSGVLTQNTNKKDERIKEFVTKILAQYPPKK